MKLGFQAIGTSSAAIATSLGYQDGENLEFSELVSVVKQILASTQLPLNVDIESGYSRDPLMIVEHIQQLVDMGVVGTNIEDSVVDKERILLDADKFAKTLAIIREQLAQREINLFLNVRTDPFLLAHPQAAEETKHRIHLFEKAGADGIFVPCIEKQDDIKTMTEATQLPINVMCMPNLPDFQILKSLGVKRISMGNFFFNNMYSHLEQVLSAVVKQQSFQPIF